MDIIDETGTFYVDNIEYDFNGCDPGVYMLLNIYDPEGYANQLYTSGGPNYQYYCKDYLGNNREVWCANTNITLQRTRYYPSGLPWRTTTGIGAGVQNRKYNDKEFVEMHGLDEYNSEARWYYPAIMRTTTMDPLAEKYYSISPYAWCGNNPVKFVDPDGMYYYDWNSKEYKTDAGEVVSWNEVKSNGFKEPIHTLLNRETKKTQMEIFLEKSDPNGVVRFMEILTKKIDEGTEWIKGMPTILRKNNKLLVVSNETGKYVDVFDPHLQKEFDLIYKKNALPKSKS